MATEKRLISLDEAIARIKDDGILGNGYSDDERIDDVCDMLESCHTVDAVEVVHGRWVTDEKGVTYCGRCKVIDDFASVHNYCPNCGAKMDGGTDGGTDGSN